MILRKAIIQFCLISKMDESNSVKAIDKTNLSEQTKLRQFQEFVTILKEKDKYEKIKDNLRSENEEFKVTRLSSVKSKNSCVCMKWLILALKPGIKLMFL